MAFKPVLIVVDMQNDFCLPEGSLSVAGALDTIPLINRMLDCPAFTFRVATKDWHPADHISFASNHPPPNNKPFESFIEMRNLVANKPDEKMQQRLWPVHCVQESSGAEIVKGINIGKIDLIVEKGTDERVEMYSAFSDSFGNLTSGEGGVTHDLAALLRDRGTSHVYVVGVAGDYCVNSTALDAAKAGFPTFVVEEGQRCVDPSAWSQVKEGFDSAGVKVIGERSPEMAQLGLG